MGRSCQFKQSCLARKSKLKAWNYWVEGAKGCTDWVNLEKQRTKNQSCGLFNQRIGSEMRLELWVIRNYPVSKRWKPTPKKIIIRVKHPCW